MARRKKVYDDDDGRTIADMSGVSRPSMFGVRSPAGKKPQSDQKLPESSDRPWEEQDQLSPEERRMYIFGALRAALLIALVFIVGLGLAIALMLWIWS